MSLIFAYPRKQIGNVTRNIVISCTLFHLNPVVEVSDLMIPSFLIL